MNPENKREIAVLRLSSLDVQASEPTPNGDVVVRVHAIIPKDVLRTTRILLSGTGTTNVLHGALAAQPTVEIQIYSDRLNPSFLERMKLNQESGDPNGEKE